MSWLDKTLCDTCVTAKMVVEELKHTFQSNVDKLTDISAEIIGKNEGFTSTVMRVWLRWDLEKSTTNLPSSIIIKVVSQELLDKMMDQSNFLLADEVLKTECNAYRILNSEYSQFPLPKAYNVTSNNSDIMKMLLLEDLTPIGKCENMLTGASKKQLLNCAKAIAKLQAWSLNTELNWQRALPTFDKMLEMSKGMCKMAPKLIEQVEKNHSYLLEIVKKDLILERLQEKHLIQFVEDYRKMFPEVLVHGDFWLGNILFQKGESDDDAAAGEELVAIIDWQAAHSGSLAEDLAKLLCVCVDPDLLDAILEEVVKHYYVTMKSLAPAWFDRLRFEDILYMVEKSMAFNYFLFILMIEKIEEISSKNFPGKEQYLRCRFASGLKRAAKFYQTEIFKF